MTNCQAPEGRQPSCRMSCVHEEKRSDKLRQYLKEVAMGANQAAADPGHFTRRVSWPCDPSAPELAERQNARDRELNRRKQHRREQRPEVGCHHPRPIFDPGRRLRGMSFPRPQGA
jgi:hypothetical protein